MTDLSKDFDRATDRLIDKMKQEGTTTDKTNDSKEEHAEITKKQEKALIALARAMADNTRTMLDAEKQERKLAQAIQLVDRQQLTNQTMSLGDSIKYEAEQQRKLVQAQQLIDRNQLTNETMSLGDSVKYEAEQKANAVIQEQKWAQFRKNNKSITEEVITAREKEFAALKKQIIANNKIGASYKEQLSPLNRLKNFLLGVVGAHKKLASATMLSVRNQRNLHNETKSFGGTLSVWRSKLLIASFGVGLVQKAVSNLIGEYAKYQASQSRVFAVLKSTNHISGQTTRGLSELASEIQKNTGVSDTLTLSSSALLATFTQIGGETFPTAQKAIVDMTSAMNAGQVTQEGLKSSTVQVGKALNDPIKGITALSRVGVAFTQKQKDLIKAHVNSGKVAKAQTIILKELNKEFGGTASADSYEKSLRQLDSAFGDLQKDIGFVLLPVFEYFIERLSSGVEWISENKRAIVEFTVALGLATGALKAYAKWQVLTNAAMAAGTTRAIQLSKALTALASKTIVGIAVVALGALIQKMIESTGVFDSFDGKVEDATNALYRFHNQAEAVAHIHLMNQGISETDELMNSLIKQIELGTFFTEKMHSTWGFNFEPYIRQTITLADGHKIVASTTKEAIKKAEEYIKILILQKKGYALGTEEAQNYLDELKRQVKIDIASDIENTTKKYQDQLAVLGKKSDLDKELTKVGLDLKIGGDTLSEALKTQTGQYFELANAIAEVVEKKKEQVQQEEIINGLMEYGSESITFMSELANSTMQADIENAKKSRAYELAQKRGDDKKMAALEKEAAAKTLKNRQNLFMAEKAMAIAQVVIDYTRAKAKGFAGAGPIFGWSMAAMMQAQMLASIALITQQAVMGMPKFARGGDFETSGPQMIMVGDNPGGRERVQVTPLSSPNIEGPQGGSNITVNVSGNVLTQDFVEDELAEAIRDAARRGTDFGIS